MHAGSYHEMKHVLYRYLDPARPLRVLDVGAACVNVSFPHTYREHMAGPWEYVGADVQAGPNVDLVMRSAYRIQKDGGRFDAVISGQCLEHVERPWALVREMARMLKVGGCMILTAPWRWEMHRWPIDCWRILPDGMRVLLRDAGLDVLETYTVADDCWGIGRK